MRVLLIAVLVASGVAAFQLGRGARAERAGAPSPVLDDEAAPPGGAVEPTRDLLNETRRLGVGRRFLAFTRELEGDTLARLLPEMVGKMEEAQLREMLVRVIEETEPGPSAMLAQIHLVGRWMQLDAGAALAYIESSTNPKLRHDMKRHAIGAWAAADPGAALAYLDEAEELPSAATEAFWEGFATPLDVRATLEFIPGLLAKNDGRDLGRAVGALFRHDGETVADWARKLPAGELRDEALLGVAAEWARHDPAAARAWIGQHASAANRDEALERLASIEPDRTDPKALQRSPIADP